MEPQINLPKSSTTVCQQNLRRWTNNLKNEIKLKEENEIFLYYLKNLKVKLRFFFFIRMASLVNFPNIKLTS